MEEIFFRRRDLKGLDYKAEARETDDNIIPNKIEEEENKSIKTKISKVIMLYYISSFADNRISIIHDLKSCSYLFFAKNTERKLSLRFAFCFLKAMLLFCFLFFLISFRFVQVFYVLYLFSLYDNLSISNGKKDN